MYVYVLFCLQDRTLYEKNPTFNSYENEIQASFQLFSKFVKEVFFRLQQYKDELLASCLQVILVLPIEIVLQEIDTLMPALEVCFFNQFLWYLKNNIIYTYILYKFKYYALVQIYCNKSISVDLKHTYLI